MIAESWNGFVWVAYGFTALALLIEIAAVCVCRKATHTHLATRQWTAVLQRSDA